MKYLQLKRDLFLVEQEIEKTSGGTEPEPVNHIWIYDRSWSMSSSLPRLAEDLIARAEKLPLGDTLTLGWFSSEGQSDYVLKGFRINDSRRDCDALKSIIARNSSPLGCTCFSEVLAGAESVIGNLSAIHENFALCFFTDGYPVVNNYGREVKAIKSALKAIEGRLSASLMVGYGRRYNKELLADMASWAGGSVIHSENLGDFSVSLSDFVKSSRELDTRIEVSLECPSDCGLAFSLHSQNITLYDQQDGRIRYAPVKRRGNNHVYTLVEKLPAGSASSAVEVKLTDFNVTGGSPAESMVKAAYAAACICTQKTRTDVALEILGTIGDAELIDDVCNAFTNTEYGRVEAGIRKAMSSPSARFSGGRCTSYLPKEDAFSLLDAIGLLQDDGRAYFYPKHEAFKYRRIGARSVQLDESVSFKADPNTRCPMKELTWNSKRLNLSVLAKVDGSVELLPGYKKLGFQKRFPTFVWKNYTLVRDGLPNVDVLPASMSRETFHTLKYEGMIDSSERYGKNKIFLVALDKVPVVNRAAARNLSAADFCGKLWKEWQLKGTIKALKTLRAQEAGGSADEGFDYLSREQQEFLAAHYITPKGFSPKMVKEESADFYMAKEFDVKIKGVSSLPKLEKVVAKIEGNRTLTAAEALLQNGIRKYDKSGVKRQPQIIRLAWFDDTIERTRRKLLAVRKELQETMFSIVLGKKWFDEFSSRENNTLELNGNQFSISLREVRVEL
jgi:hypothetical protein